MVLAGVDGGADNGVDNNEDGVGICSLIDGEGGIIILLLFSKFFFSTLVDGVDCKILFINILLAVIENCNVSTVSNSLAIYIRKR